MRIAANVIQLGDLDRYTDMTADRAMMWADEVSVTYLEFPSDDRYWDWAWRGWSPTSDRLSVGLLSGEVIIETEMVRPLARDFPNESLTYDIYLMVEGHRYLSKGLFGPTRHHRATQNTSLGYELVKDDNVLGIPDVDAGFGGIHAGSILNYLYSDPDYREVLANQTGTYVSFVGTEVSEWFQGGIV